MLKLAVPVKAHFERRCQDEFPDIESAGAGRVAHFEGREKEEKRSREKVSGRFVRALAGIRKGVRKIFPAPCGGLVAGHSIPSPWPCRPSNSRHPEAHHAPPIAQPSATSARPSPDSLPHPSHRPRPPPPPSTSRKQSRHVFCPHYVAACLPPTARVILVIDRSVRGHRTPSVCDIRQRRNPK